MDMLLLRKNFSPDLQCIVAGVPVENACIGNQFREINLSWKVFQSDTDDELSISFFPDFSELKSVISLRGIAEQHISFRVIETCECFHTFFVSVTAHISNLCKHIRQAVKRNFNAVSLHLRKLYQNLNILRL